MRIIRGRFKTRKYKLPKNFPSRPTTDFAKEGLFNIIENKIDTEDLSLLDLCTGTGNISIEFLSREWGTAVAVDQNYNAYKHLSQLRHELEINDELTVIKSDIISFLKRTDTNFDIIFADPPYAFDKYEELIDLVFEKNLLKENGILIVEHGKQTSFENRTQFDFCRIYGNVCFSFFENK